MTYLIAHIAIFLVFADLLGLLLGWLIWGYVSRQRAAEVQVLRDRLADMQLISARAATVIERQLSLGESSHVLIEGDLPDAEMVHTPFFEEEVEKAPMAPVTRIVPVTPDLEAEVKESKIEYLEQQLRELESVRDRVPILQADLSEALAGRREAESRYQSAKNDFEVRASGLVAQIRDFENLARESDKSREEFERSDMNREKELATVKAHLRDLQNSQRPQVAEPLAATAPSATAIEIADLRERHQIAVDERNAFAAQLELSRQNSNVRYGDPAQLAERIAELEQVVRTKDASLSEQVTRIESLLWQVAELEPFVAGAPQMEENLRRQESEIAGHLAMHAEGSDQIRALESQLAELQSDTTASLGLKNEWAQAQIDHRSELQRLSDEHAVSLGQFQQSLEEKHEEIAQYLATQANSAERIRTLEKQVTELDSARLAGEALTKQLDEHRAEAQLLSEEHARSLAGLRQTVEQQRGEIARHEAAGSARAQEIQTLQGRLTGVQAAADGLQKQLKTQQTEIQRLTTEHAQKLGELHKSVDLKQIEIAQYLIDRDEQIKRISGLQDRLKELEAVAGRVGALEKSLSDRNTEIQGLLSAHGDMHREMTGWKDYAVQMQPAVAKLPELENAVLEREAEIVQLKDAHSEKDGQLKLIEERLTEMSELAASHRHQLLELQPLAARVPEVEDKLKQQEAAALSQTKTVAERHQAELTKLKVNSAQRLRRLRQGITSFKG